MPVQSNFHRIAINLIRYSVIWILACLFFGLVRAYGVESLPGYDRTLPFHWDIFIIQMLVLGVATGIPFGIANHILDSSRIKYKPYWELIVIKSMVQLMIAIFSMTVLIIITNQIGSAHIGFIQIFFSSTALLWILFSGFISFAIHFFQAMKSKTGERVLWNLLLGKYHRPRVESRIFMFLDMKNSTTHAETLGHIRFSSLIQDCIKDLTSAILQHQVEVYQYVGDEAVLTWKIHEGLENANCLNAYYTFCNSLNARRIYYEKKYGLMPFFKAGVHIGAVSVSEVGIIKREIAYHSDVLNTAARIQGMCNEFEAELLVSKELHKGLNHKNGFGFESIGGVALKGKLHPVDIYKVTKRS